jgi:hypothetical protein
MGHCSAGCRDLRQHLFEDATLADPRFADNEKRTEALRIECPLPEAEYLRRLLPPSGEGKDAMIQKVHKGSCGGCLGDHHRISRVADHE